MSKATYPAVGLPLASQLMNRVGEFRTFFQPHIRTSEGTGQYLPEFYETTTAANEAAKKYIEETKGKQQ